MGKRSYNSQYDWRHDDSALNKKLAGEARYGDEPPGCLWYDLGSEFNPSQEELVTATAPIFQFRSPGADDLKIHQSRKIKDSKILRVRGTKVWVPKLFIGERECFLVQLGNSEDKRSFNFEEQWNRATFLPGSLVRLNEYAKKFGLSVNGRKFTGHNSTFESLTVVETMFSGSMQRAQDLMNAFYALPALAHIIAASHENGVWTIPDGDLEIVTLLSQDGETTYTICAEMVELIVHAQ